MAFSCICAIGPCFQSFPMPLVLLCLLFFLFLHKQSGNLRMSWCGTCWHGSRESSIEKHEGSLLRHTILSHDIVQRAERRQAFLESVQWGKWGVHCSCADLRKKGVYVKIAREGRHKPCIHACMYVYLCSCMCVCIWTWCMCVRVHVWRPEEAKTALICHACLVPKSGSCNEPGSSS